MGRKEKSESDVIKTFTFNKDGKDSEGSFVNQLGLKVYCKYWSRELPSPRYSMGGFFSC